MRYLLLCTLAAFLFVSCESDISTDNAGPGSDDGYNIQPSDYRRNTFFLDTSFIPMYELYYALEPPNESYSDLITPGSVKVWKTASGASNNNTHAFAWYALPPLPETGTYSTTFHASGDGKSSASGWVELVDTSQYNVNYKTGVLRLQHEPGDLGEIVGVSYRTPDGRQFGEEESGKDVLVLKLIKGERAFSDTVSPTFKNVLRNSYLVGALDIGANGFSVRITYSSADKTSDQIRSAQGTVRSLSVMGLDRYTNTGVKASDGEIDLFNPSTIILDKQSGTLTFPYLEPFGKRILDFHDEQLRIDPQYLPDSTFYLPDVYVQAPEYVKQHVPKNAQITINAMYK